MLFAGRLLLGGEGVEGWIEVADGRLADWGEGAPDGRPDATGWMVPSPVNAHTHVGDSFLREKPGKPATVPELVGPGGWKHRHLAAATQAQVEAGVERYVGEMAAVGTAAFLDFREGGPEGARLLREMAELPARAVVLGRPRVNRFDEAEVADLLRVADGIGISARRDFPNPRDVEAIAEACHKARKPFALHASEARREDIDAVLALEPTFLVHLTQASRGDLERVADAAVGVVVCPRSNAYYGLRTPLEAMQAAGLEVAVGTDNGMLQDGNLLAELAQLQDWFPRTSVATLLAMATENARPLAGLPEALPPRKGSVLDLVVLPENPWGIPPSRRPGFLVPEAP